MHKLNALATGNNGDIFNVAPATLQTVRKVKGLLPNEFA
jgi:phosphopantothenoylcysteine synthetase/decarboxylase